MTFKENQERMRRVYQQRLKQQKKQKRKENILTFFIAFFIITTTIMLLNFVGKEQQKSINNCMNNGYSYASCVKGA